LYAGDKFKRMLHFDYSGKYYSFMIMNLSLIPDDPLGTLSTGTNLTDVINRRHRVLASNINPTNITEQSYL
jgi:hypothetical protein